MAFQKEKLELYSLWRHAPTPRDRFGLPKIAGFAGLRKFEQRRLQPVHVYSTDFSLKESLVPDHLLNLVKVFEYKEKTDELGRDSRFQLNVFSLLKRCKNLELIWLRKNGNYFRSCAPGTSRLYKHLASSFRGRLEQIYLESRLQFSTQNQVACLCKLSQHAVNLKKMSFGGVRLNTSSLSLLIQVSLKREKKLSHFIVSRLERSKHWKSSSRFYAHLLQLSVKGLVATDYIGIPFTKISVCDSLVAKGLTTAAAESTAPQSLKLFLGGSLKSFKRQLKKKWSSQELIGLTASRLTCELE